MCDLITVFDIYNIWNAIMADDGKAAGDFKKSPAADFMERLFCSAVAVFFSITIYNEFVWTNNRLFRFLFNISSAAKGNMDMISIYQLFDCTCSMFDNLFFV